MGTGSYQSLWQCEGVQQLCWMYSVGYSWYPA